MGWSRPRDRVIKRLSRVAGVWGLRIIGDEVYSIYPSRAYTRLRDRQPPQWYPVPMRDLVRYTRGMKDPEIDAIRLKRTQRVLGRKLLVEALEEAATELEGVRLPNIPRLRCALEGYERRKGL